MLNASKPENEAPRVHELVVKTVAAIPCQENILREMAEDLIDARAELKSLVGSILLYKNNRERLGDLTLDVLAIAAEEVQKRYGWRKK